MDGGILDVLLLSDQSLVEFFLAYGFACNMRSCALRILLAATISIARVIFCVFLMLRILVRISFATAMHHYLFFMRTTS